MKHETREWGWEPRLSLDWGRLDWAAASARQPLDSLLGAPCLGLPAWALQPCVGARRAEAGPFECRPLNAALQCPGAPVRVSASSGRRRAYTTTLTHRLRRHCKASTRASTRASTSSQQRRLRHRLNELQCIYVIRDVPDSTRTRGCWGGRSLAKKILAGSILGTMDPSELGRRNLISYLTLAECRRC